MTSFCPIKHRIWSLLQALSNLFLPPLTPLHEHSQLPDPVLSFAPGSDRVTKNGVLVKSDFFFVVLHSKQLVSSSELHIVCQARSAQPYVASTVAAIFYPHISKYLGGGANLEIN